MNNENVYVALSSLISLLGICYLLFWRYRKYSVDKFRQDFFILRDELFDYAAEGNISFNHTAYLMLRRTMNGFIRFGHRISLWQCLYLFISTSKEEMNSAMEFDKTFRAATEQLDDSVQKRLHQFRDRMEATAMRHIITSSPELLLLILPMLLALVMWAAWKVGSPRIQRTIQAAVRERFRGLDDTALIMGE